MKKNLLILSFSALLLVSSGISSQTTDKQNKVATLTPSTHDSLTTEPALDVDRQDGLILANVNIDPVINKNTVIRDSQNRKPLEINIDIKETDVVNIETTGAKYFSDEEIAHLRELFLQAETALKNKKEKKYFQLADQLKEYPLFLY